MSVEVIRQANMANFKGGIEKLLAPVSEAGRRMKRLATAGDDFNLELNGAPVFNPSAKAEARKRIEVSQKSPSRILFGKPFGMFQDDGDKSALPEEVAVQFLTQRYDDVNRDIHVLDFQRDVSAALSKTDVKITEKVTNKNPYYVVVMGLGLGFQLEWIYDAYKPRHLIVVEADPEFLDHSLDVFDWVSFSTRVKADKAQLTLIIEPNQRNMLARLNATVQTDCIMGLDGLMTLKFSDHPVINVVYSEFQSSKTGNLASYMGYTVDEFNMMKNSFRNLRPGTRRLLGVVRTKAKLPALIVGSGPSLEQNLEFVRSIRDRVILVASGSSLAVLLRNGIYPDIQAVLERAKGNFDRHAELATEFDLKRIRAVLTTTIWPGTADFFADSVFFLRPALSPIGVFCHNEAEILNGEGPQVTNTAFAFAGRLGFKEIYLLGVDLGARDPNRPRAERAWLTPGLKQRELTVPVRGNFGRTVFTDNGLIQQRVNIENQILKLSAEGTKVFNLGDGVRINGASPLLPTQVDLPKVRIKREHHVKELFEQFSVVSRERFISDWESSHVRINVCNMVKALIATVEQASAWDHDVMKKLENINSYLNKSVKAQYAPRLLRGSVLRMCLQLSALFNRVPADRHGEVLDLIKPIWRAMMERLEREAYELADELESEDEYFSVVTDGGPDVLALSAAGESVPALES